MIYAGIHARIPTRIQAIHARMPCHATPGVPRMPHVGCYASYNFPGPPEDAPGPPRKPPGCAVSKGTRASGTWEVLGKSAEVFGSQSFLGESKCNLCKIIT